MSATRLTVEMLEKLQDWADGFIVTPRDEMRLAIPPQLDLRWNEEEPMDGVPIEERFVKDSLEVHHWHGRYEMQLVWSSRGELVAQSKLRRVK